MAFRRNERGGRGRGQSSLTQYKGEQYKIDCQWGGNHFKTTEPKGGQVKFIVPQPNYPDHSKINNDQSLRSNLVIMFQWRQGSNVNCQSNDGKYFNFTIQRCFTVELFL